MKNKIWLGVFLIFIALGSIAYLNVKAEVNLIPNPSLETGTSGQPTGWFSNNWASGQATFGYPVKGYNSSKAVRIDVQTVAPGDGKFWSFGYIPVIPGKQYKFSNYSRSNAISYVLVEYRLQNGQYFQQTLDLMGPHEGWNKFEYIFKAPAGAVDMTILHLLNKPGWLVIDEYDLQEWTGPDPNVFDSGIITLAFDDGYRSIYTNALPKLEETGLTSTHYIFSDSAVEERPGYVSRDEVIDIRQKGHEIGSHSSGHTSLVGLSNNELIEELMRSKLRLQSFGIGEVRSFAYPYGEFDTWSYHWVKLADYKGARTVERGFNKRSTDPFLLRTQVINPSTTVQQIESWIDQAINSKTWLIISFHSVDNSGNDFSITPENFQKVVDMLVSKNVKVVTVSEGLKFLTPIVYSWLPVQ